MSTKTTLALAMLATLSIAQPTFLVAADLRVCALFQDSMVLQRDQPCRVWGWSQPNQTVTVQIADQKQSAVADEDGKWSLNLTAMSAGGPYEMVVSDQHNRLPIQDVHVGEVWLCSGQSNMAMTVSRANDFENEAKAADLPTIRMFKVTSPHARQPQETVAGQWTVCSPGTVGGFSATAYFFGRRLHQELKVPIGLINSSVGGTSIESWTSLKAQQAVPEIQPRLDAWDEADRNYDAKAAQQTYTKAVERWEIKAKAAKAAGKKPPRKPTLTAQPNQDRNYPSNLFNGKIHPIVGYTMRGAIWYQGENSSGRGFSHLYEYQLPTLIKDWRHRWGQGEFPFGWVQLPNFRSPQTEPVESNGWSLVQNGMFRSLGVPNTGMAITIDVGDAKDIHPKDKQTVGFRLAQWALADVYDQSLIPMGPIYRNASLRDNDQMVIEFDHADGLHSKTDTVEGFAIAGPDKKFVWADARIEGERVIVSSPQVRRPIAVRYAWAANPVFSLYNSAGLPASPFRTDDFVERGR